MHEEGAGQDKKLVQLNLGLRNLLRCLRAFYVCKKNAGVDIESTWCEISWEEFNDFRMSLWDPEHNYKLNSASSLIGPSTASTNLPTKTAPKYTQAELFERSLKKDPSLFPVLQDIVHWDNWHREFKTQAKLQGCAQVLEENYTPSTAEDKELFSRQSLYIYSVFV